MKRTIAPFGRSLSIFLLYILISTGGLVSLCLGAEKQTGSSTPCIQISRDTIFAKVKTIQNRTDSAQIYFTNCGEEATTYTITIQADDSNVYEFRQIISPDPDSLTHALKLDSIQRTLQPGQRDSARIQFTAVGRGPIHGSLFISSSGVPLDSIPMLGTSAVVSIRIVPDTVPTTPVGGHSLFNIHIKNIGDVIWSSEDPQLSDPADFIPRTKPFDLAPGDSILVQFEFAPTYEDFFHLTIKYFYALPSLGPRYFTVVTAQSYIPEAVSPIADATALSIEPNFPNPCTDFTTISFMLEQGGYTELLVYDEKGTLVKALVHDRLTSGRHRAQLNTSNLNSGIYFCLLRSGGKETVRSILVGK